MIRPILLFAVLTILLVSPSPAQSEGTKENENLNYREQAEKFLDMVQKGEYRESIDFYFSGNPWMQAKPDELATIKAQMSGLSDLLGEFRSYDLVTEQHFGESFVYVLYVANFDRSPLSFHMSFYKPTDRWMAYTIEYQEDLLALAKELAQLKLTIPPIEGANTSQPKKALHQMISQSMILGGSLQNSTPQAVGESLE